MLNPPRIHFKLKALEHFSGQQLYCETFPGIANDQIQAQQIILQLWDDWSRKTKCFKQHDYSVEFVQLKWEQL